MPPAKRTATRRAKGQAKPSPIVPLYRPDLRTALPDLYMTLAWAYQDAGGELTPHILYFYLPARALELSQSCGLVPRSDATFMITSSEQSDLVPTAIPDGFLQPGEAAIGFWCVTKRFKEDFMRLLEEPITSLKSIAATEQALSTNPTAIRWMEPTPAQHIKRFLRLKHWSLVMLIKEVSRIDTYVCETTKQFLKRLRRPPETTRQVRIDSRTHHRLERLLAVMSTNAPQQFGSLKIDDLRWTSVESNA